MFNICPHCIMECLRTFLSLSGGSLMETLMAAKQVIAMGLTTCLLFVISYCKGGN